MDRRVHGTTDGPIQEAGGPANPKGENGTWDDSQASPLKGSNALPLWRGAGGVILPNEGLSALVSADCPKCLR